MQNVYHTRNSNPSQNLSRKEIIKWINSTLNIDIKKLEDLGSGAEYCQLFNQLHPDTINLKKVKHGSHLQADFQANFLLLQLALQKVGVDKDIKIGRMIVGGRRENLDFAQWFKKLYDRNIDKKDTVFQDVSEPSKRSSSKRSSSKQSSSKRSTSKRSSSKQSSSKRSSSSTVVPSRTPSQRSVSLTPFPKTSTRLRWCKEAYF
ncbi:microtubule-associated protein RP/EB family member 1-like [Drosophila miranda]|uniref:microtubule-associated protein RP/EB family member 1-like n=1 Tax=Drosophila miranda TaxID=7229 RepID=UPI00143FAA57|nr:microtubule-associated protein RP/EB family member 1-like [Drosophila miranda]